MVAVYLQGLAEGRTQAIQQFGACPALAVYAGYFDDPADPEWAVLLNDSCELLAHVFILPYQAVHIPVSSLLCAANYA